MPSAQVCNLHSPCAPAWNGPTARDLLHVLALSALLLVLALLLGCKSDTRRISESANLVVSLAHETIEELGAAIQTGEVGPAAVPHVEKADANQRAIIGEGEKVHQAAAGVVDKTSPWVAVFYWLFVALAIAGACFLLWYTGVGFVVKRALWSIGLLIPQFQKSAASLDREALLAHPNSPEINAAVAAKRENPAYRAAWKKVRRGEEKREALKQRYVGA
jgi:hypothetical protein